MNRTERRERKIVRIIAASAQVEAGILQLRERQASQPFFVQYDSRLLADAEDASMGGRRTLYFKARDKFSQPRLVFPTYLDGKRLNIVNPEFRESYN